MLYIKDLLLFYALFQKNKFISLSFFTALINSLKYTYFNLSFNICLHFRLILSYFRTIYVIFFTLTKATS